MATNYEVEVRQRAYELWLGSGRVEGRDRDHWLAAEREVSRKREQALIAAAVTPPPAKARKAGSKAKSKKG